MDASKPTDYDISRVMAHLASRQKGKPTARQIAARKLNAEKARRHKTVIENSVTDTNCHSDHK